MAGGASNLLFHERNEIRGYLLGALPVGAVTDLRVDSQPRATDRRSKALLIVPGKQRVAVAPKQNRRHAYLCQLAPIVVPDDAAEQLLPESRRQFQALADDLFKER